MYSSWSLALHQNMLLKIVNYDAIYNYIYVLKISFGLI